MLVPLCARCGIAVEPVPGRDGRDFCPDCGEARNRALWPVIEEALLPAIAPPPSDLGDAIRASASAAPARAFSRAYFLRCPPPGVSEDDLPR